MGSRFMAHRIAKLLLEHAITPREREDAIEKALALGMPLEEIEEYLQWLDALRRRKNNHADGPKATE